MAFAYDSLWYFAWLHWCLGNYSSARSIRSERRLLAGRSLYSDKLYELDEINNGLKVSYDAAHPLKVEKNFLLSFLYDNFEVMYDEKIRNQFEMDGEHFEWDDVYFIGKKKS